MNKLIQELAYQAEEYADSVVDQGGEFHQAYTQKLSELIVRECTNIVLHYASVDEGVSVAKKHFGFEE